MRIPYVRMHQIDDFLENGKRHRTSDISVAYFCPISVVLFGLNLASFGLNFFSLALFGLISV